VTAVIWDASTDGWDCNSIALAVRLR
jgi:hypothetical protein